MKELITRKEFERSAEIVRKYFEQITEHQKEVKKFVGTIPEYDAETMLHDCPFSFRSISALRANSDRLGLSFDWQTGSTIKDLENVSVGSLLRCRNFGKKSIKEIETIAMRAGITIGKNV